MEDWKVKEHLKGTKVKVYNTFKEYLGIGKLVYDYTQDTDQMPEIEMPDGKVLFGYECWWIPVSETEGL